VEETSSVWENIAIFHLQVISYVPQYIDKLKNKLLRNIGSSFRHATVFIILSKLFMLLTAKFNCRSCVAPYDLWNRHESWAEKNDCVLFQGVLSPLSERSVGNHKWLGEPVQMSLFESSIPRLQFKTLGPVRYLNIPSLKGSRLY
jgi:hypothetical protein